MRIKCLPSGPLMVNTYLVWDENTKEGFIVDPGGHDSRMLNAVAEDELRIKYIVLTHGHADHIGGVEQYLKEDFPTAQLVASKLEKPLLADPDANSSRSMLGHPVVLTPDLAVTEQDTLEVGNMTLHFISTPGHTPGGMCIRIGKVLFSGDTLFQASIGRTDFPGGSMDALVSSIRNKLFTLPDETRVFPGHMGETQIGYEKRHNPFV